MPRQERNLADQIRCPSVSVVIVTYNRESVLCNTITSVLGQDYPAFELLVIDQSENHDLATRAFLESLSDDRFRIIRLTPPGMCNARNVGAELAKGDIVIYIDDDVILAPGYIAAHATSYADSTVGGVGGPVKEGNVNFVVRVRHDGRLAIIRPFHGASLDTSKGCNMSFRRDLLKRVGYFDTGYIEPAVIRDETDMCFRIRKQGYRIVYNAQASLEHLRSPRGGTRATSAMEEIYDRMYNVMRFTHKNIPHDVPLVFLTHVLIALKKSLLVSRRPVQDFLWLISGLYRGFRSVVR